MANFDAQVIDLVGSSWTEDQDAVNQFITEGANEVINAMPRSMLERVAEETPVTTGTTASVGHKVLHMLRNDGTIDQPCRRIPANKRGRAADSDDMEYATTSDPAYYVKDGKFNILPSGAGLLVSMPTYSQTAPLDASDISTIPNFPNEAEYLVTLYAAMKALQQNMNSKTSNLPADITFPSIPVAPVAPSFDTGAISVSSSAPTYTSPVFSAPTLATVGSLTLPVTPTTPTLSAQSVTITGTVPVYVGPSYSKIDTYIDTDEDVELAQAKLQEVSSQVQDALNKFNDSNVEYQAKLQKDIQDSQLSDANEARKLQKYSSEVQTYSAEVNARVQEWVNEEWTQKFQKYQQDYSGRLQEHGNNLQDTLNKFNKENTVFQNELQEKIQEANNQQTKDSAEYSATLQRYSNEMQGYVAEVNKSVQDFSTKLQKHTTDYGWLQSQHQQLSADYQRGIQLLRGG